MKVKYFLILFLMVPIVFLGCWVANIEYSLKTENTVVVRMTGYDPVDLLSGHYLLLRPDWSQTDCSQFDKQVCPTELFAYSYRYYLPEFDAQELDRKIFNTDLQVDLVFSYNGKAKPLVKQLLINGQEWSKWLSQFAK